MTVWRAWHPSAVAEWRSATSPYLVRFAGCGVPSAAPLSPTRDFPSFWADLSTFSARELDFFAQCVDHISSGVGQSVPARVDRALRELSRAPARSPAALCDVVLLPDGQPCLGWFHDGFDARHYGAVVAALEERWRRRAASLWALRERSVAAEAAGLSRGGRAECFAAPSREWRRARLAQSAARHARHRAAASASPPPPPPPSLCRRDPRDPPRRESAGEALAALVARGRGAQTPRARDDAIAAALRQCAAVAAAADEEEAALMRRHCGRMGCSESREAGGSGAPHGLVDAAALDAAMVPAVAPRETRSKGFEAKSKGFETKSKEFGFGPAWMPGIGADAFGYISGLLAACDALVGMTVADECAAPNEAQHAVVQLRHKVRVHVARRFGFAVPAALWSSAALAARAEPFLDALLDSMERPKSCRAVLRVRDGAQLPRPFDAADFPSPVLCALQESLQLPAAAPAFFVECGTVEELEAAGAARRIVCRFSPIEAESFSAEFAAGDGVIAAIASAAREAMRKGPENRFADIEVHVRAGAVSLTLKTLPLCPPTGSTSGRESEKRNGAEGEEEEAEEQENE